MSRKIYGFISWLFCICAFMSAALMTNRTLVPAYGIAGVVVMGSIVLSSSALAFIFSRLSRRPPSKRFPRGHPWRL